MTSATIPLTPLTTFTTIPRQIILECVSIYLPLTSTHVYVWKIIKEILLEAAELFVPKVRIRTKQYPKWFTSHEANCLRTLRKKYNHSPTDYNLNRLTTAEKMFNDKVKSAKVTNETNLTESFLSHSNPAVCRYLRSITNYKGLPTTAVLNNTHASDDHGKANLFNKYFSSIFTKDSSVLLEPPEYIHSTNCIENINISEDEVFEALTGLDPNKAMGIDNINPKILKYCASALVQPIHHLFSLTLVNQSLPQDWKMYIITPVHKSGNKSAVNSYRSISLLCVVSKVLERIIFNKISNFIVEFISPNQFGFLQGRSCSQLLLFLNDIYESAAQNTQTDVIYLDFKKAFDTISHTKLLLKLYKIGITGNLWKWFHCYLANRVQCVKVNHSLSDVLPACCFRSTPGKHTGSSIVPYIHQ